MPKRIIKGKAAQRIRKGALQRQKSKAAGCKTGNRKKESGPRIIAGSLFALTLNPIPLMAIKGMPRSRFDHEDDDYELMYSDILPIIQRAIKLVTNEDSSFNPLENGYDLNASFNFMLNVFKREVLPKDWDFNIERSHSDGHYHIVIYSDCEFQAFWHVFEIGDTVLSLKKSNLKLHNMFVRFMYNFCRSTGIEPWFGGGLGYVEYSWKEFIPEWLERHEMDTEEETEQLKISVTENCNSYNKGIVKGYEKLLIAQPILPIPILRKQLNAFRKSNALVAWMKQACDIMELPCTIDSFIYPEYCQREEGLFFDQQLALLWSSTDHLASEQEEYLEAESQGVGIMSPILTIRLYKDTERLDFKELKEVARYPQKLTKLLHQYNESIKKYERKN